MVALVLHTKLRQTEALRGSNLRLCWDGAEACEGSLAAMPLVAVSQSLGNPRLLDPAISLMWGHLLGMLQPWLLTAGTELQSCRFFYEKWAGRSIDQRTANK